MMDDVTAADVTRDEVSQILDDFVQRCRKGEPNLDADGYIFSVYDRFSFENLWKTIGDLYFTLTLLHIPTKWLNIDVDDEDVVIELAYDGLKVLLAVYPSEDDEEG